MTRPAVLVTGGAKRIGAVLARAFADEGWHIVIHYGTSEDAARELADELPSARIVQCDLRDGDAAEAMVEGLSHELADWRCLVNCAAVFDPDDVADLDPDTSEKAMQVNALSPVRLAQAYLRAAKASAGRRVIQFLDQKIANPNPDFFSYTMAKHAAAGAVPMLAMGATKDADRIYGLAPGAILASHDQSEEETEISHRLNPLKRKTGANEIASAALFLAHGHLADGETLFVDSGQHLLAQDRDVIYLARRGETP
ncbi:SDR family oxidoreductase [Qipengyuania sp. JC766]|uniref:SDR family oxidoreductase n=1 Tax=Qipengyuania sp. JC766 TaxID=3232139 RepID=UPI00345B2340